MAAAAPPPPTPSKLDETHLPLVRRVLAPFFLPEFRAKLRTQLEMAMRQYIRDERTTMTVLCLAIRIHDEVAQSPDESNTRRVLPVAMGWN